MAYLIVSSSLALGLLAGAALGLRALRRTPRWPLLVALSTFAPLLSYPGQQASALAAFLAGFVLSLHVVVVLFRDGWDDRRGGEPPEPPEPPWWPQFERDLDRYRRAKRKVRKEERRHALSR